MKSHQQYLGLYPLFRRITVGGKVVGSDPALHHLAKVNGVWCLRVTIDRGPKLIGKRIKVSLGTPDIALAQKMRDKILVGYEAAGVRVIKARPGQWE